MDDLSYMDAGSGSLGEDGLRAVGERLVLGWLVCGRLARGWFMRDWPGVECWFKDIVCWEEVFTGEMRVREIGLDERDCFEKLVLQENGAVKPAQQAVICFVQPVKQIL